MQHACSSQPLSMLGDCVSGLRLVYHVTRTLSANPRDGRAYIMECGQTGVSDHYGT